MMIVLFVSLLHFFVGRGVTRHQSIMCEAARCQLIADGYVTFSRVTPARSARSVCSANLPPHFDFLSSFLPVYFLAFASGWLKNKNKKPKLKENKPVKDERVLFSRLFQFGFNCCVSSDGKFIILTPGSIDSFSL